MSFPSNYIKWLRVSPFHLGITSAISLTPWNARALLKLFSHKHLTFCPVPGPGDSPIFRSDPTGGSFIC